MIGIRHRRRALLGMAILLAAVGCRSKPLQKQDAAGGGIGGIDAGEPGDGGVPGDLGAVDAGGPADGGGPSDRPFSVPFSGRRSLIVTSQVFPAGAANALSHVFTMTVDPDQRIAITGTPGGGADFSPIEQTAAGPLRFAHGPILPIEVPANCGGSVSYDDLTFTIDRSGELTGTGRGYVTSYVDDVGTAAAATMVLTGVPDREQPKLSLAAGGNIADPWTPLWLIPSEPLAPGQPLPVLRSAGGETLTFTAGGLLSLFVTQLAKPPRMLRFDQPYQVTIDGVTDLVGNLAGGNTNLGFTTGPPPPLVAADGFESVMDATLGGAMVLSGADAPTLGGARSLYIQPMASLASGKQLAVRVAIGPGDRALRFDFRTVNPGPDATVSFVIASVGGTIESASLPSEVGAATTPAVIDGTSVVLGPLRTMTIGLPPDAHDDVVFARMASQGGRCGGPPPAPVPGMIIDDLRAE